MIEPINAHVSIQTRQVVKGSRTPDTHQMIDPFQRPVTYLRVSVTDRCNLPRTYCMEESMSFLPKKDLLTLEEPNRLCSAFIAKGVRRLRLTGGEPLVRKKEVARFV